ncbi:terminase-like family protein [Variibacter gotjawalensis]|uniref:Terminase-like family protein n=1 Tax=Variibacter gotjawalensis TaxID=1333996 RepID=A0A0S3PZ80_9BRAD|nr:terminase family protein [Variibacter gotjawalensis]NIK47076.1 phage terminase large subunit-like protein [Variibacter gotjawalensis]RZS48978.1 phage terminase large subunit-like protein [Variibacter gotjawalensis]BAT61238.1 terminase-like family protein [Variibacter gotjawalensis]
MTPAELRAVWHVWPLAALPHQFPPDSIEWGTWVLLGGRGAGKTRSGAEWVRHAVTEEGHERVALIGGTFHDVREVMIEGVAGLLRCGPPNTRPRWIPTRGRLEWPNGAIGEVYSADDPESLRGPQFDAAWLDEFAKWRYAEAAFDMLQFGLRLGARPRQVITTTPRPLPILKKLLERSSTVVCRATSADNAVHLAPTFLAAMTERYGGTVLGRQELGGEIIADRVDAMWSRDWIERSRVAVIPPLIRIVVAVDPPASSRKGADACGIVAAGRDDGGIVYVIADESSGGLTPAAWAARAVALWRRLEADVLVAEVNQGGEMVRAVIREQDAEVPVVTRHAQRSKYVRAEPVAQLYEQGRVRHAGVFPALEDEMCDFGLDGLTSGRSPDRLDALVWAISELTFARGAPRVRGL